jgi:CRISPR-associated protein (TIGR02710 family)
VNRKGWFKALFEERTCARATYLLVDLLNNAMRRGDDERKYDDAVARLYRAMELLAQRQLLTHSIDSSDVKPEDIPAELRQKWESLFEEGSAKIGLAHCYELLTALGDPLGEFYGDEKAKRLLSTRNNSILAHGLHSVNREVYVTLRDLVGRKAEENIPRYAKLLEESKFKQMELLQ